MRRCWLVLKNIITFYMSIFSILNGHKIIDLLPVPVDSFILRLRSKTSNAVAHLRIFWESSNQFFLHK